MEGIKTNDFVIETNNLCKMYGPHLALDAINLKIKSETQKNHDQIQEDKMKQNTTN